MDVQSSCRLPHRLVGQCQRCILLRARSIPIGLVSNMFGPRILQDLADWIGIYIYILSCEYLNEIPYK